jgi:hypothetical protein
MQFGLLEKSGAGVAGENSDIADSIVRAQDYYLITDMVHCDASSYCNRTAAFGVERLPLAWSNIAPG